MHTRLSLVFAALLGGCASSAPRPPDPAVAMAATCARLEAEHRDRLAAAVIGGGPDATSLAGIVDPYGDCTEPVTPAGRWAFVVTDLTVSPLGSGAEDDTPLYSVEGSARAVFVRADGRVVESEVALVPIDAIVDATGAPQSPGFPYEPQLIDLHLDTDWSGDGVPEAIVVGTRGLDLLHWDGAAVVPYRPALEALPAPTACEDLDGDGLRDLGDDATLAFHRLGDGNYDYPLRLVAHALPGGRFSTDDPMTRAFYDEACKDLGRSPWVFGRDADLLTNLACARVRGVSSASLARALEAELAALPEDADENTLAAIEGEDLVAWSTEALAIRLGRADGLRPAPIRATRAGSHEAAWRHYTFTPDQLVDGDLGSSWQPKKGTAKPWVELELERPTRVLALELANGFQRQDELGDLFLMNRRATRLRVELDGAAFEWTLDPTRREVQRFDLPTPTEAGRVKLTVLASEAGSRWQNVALSELVVLAAP